MTETTITYPCPNCGAALAFDAEKQKFACEFCLSEFDEDDLASSAADAEQAQADDEDYCGHMNEYHCPNCGAEIVTDESTAADFCLYCHAPILLHGRLSGQMKPHKIVPFQYDKAAAKEKFLAFARKKWFVPRDFFAPEHADRITGIYYPFWVTDADTFCQLDARATRVRVWRQGNTEYTETSRYAVERDGNIHFEDLVTSALSEADKTMLEGILPYPIDSLQDFSMPYLAGYQAKKRNVEREALSDEIRARMREYAETLLRGTVSGYNTVHTESLNVNVQKSHWEYTLMPIWMLTYQRKGKTYTYAMNGHTGKIYGELPVSLGRLAAACGAVCLAVAGLATLIGGFLL